jgi:uncharacterized membrane protein
MTGGRPNVRYSLTKIHRPAERGVNFFTQATHDDKQMTNRSHARRRGLPQHNLRSSIGMSSPQVFWLYFTLVAFSLAALAVAGREFWRARGLEKAHSLGRISIAVPMAVFGAEHLISARTIMNAVPAWMPGRLFWTYFVGIALIAAALSILCRVRIRLSATLLGVMLFLFVALIHVPNAIAAPQSRFTWTIVARDSSFGAGAILLAITCGVGSRTSIENRVAMAGLYLIAAVSMFFGIEHFLHPECVPAVPLAKLVPAWIPLARLWTIVTGVGLVAGAGAMLTRSGARQAAAALGAWVLFLVLTLYLAIMVAKPDIEGINYFADTLLFAGVLLVASAAEGFVGESRRGPAVHDTAQASSNA